MVGIGVAAHIVVVAVARNCFHGACLPRIRVAVAVRCRCFDCDWWNWADCCCAVVLRYSRLRPPLPHAQLTVAVAVDCCFLRYCCW